MFSSSFAFAGPGKIAVHVASFFMVVCFLSACGSAGPPVWVSSPDEVYAPNEYLTAVGDGDSNQRAQDTALANLARIFKADIQTTETLVEEYREVADDERVEVDWVSELVSATEISTGLELLNARIYESYSAPDGMYYALAGLERMPTSALYTREISNNEMQIRALQERAENERSTLASIGLLRSALTIAKVNEELVRQRNVIMGRPAESSSELSQRLALEERIEALGRRASVYVESNQNAPAELEDALKSVFQEMGLQMSSSRQQALLHVRLSFDLEDAGMNRDDADFRMWSVRVAIEDQQMNRSFAQFFQEGRSGAPTETQSRRRSVRDARNAIEQPFQRFINAQMRELVSDQ
ncbi:MAG: hypothetical protein ACOC2C_00750 [Cyclonatronaceae bacterium]